MRLQIGKVSGERPLGKPGDSLGETKMAAHAAGRSLHMEFRLQTGSDSGVRPLGKPGLASLDEMAMAVHAAGSSPDKEVRLERPACSFWEPALKIAQTRLDPNKTPEASFERCPT